MGYDSVSCNTLIEFISIDELYYDETTDSFLLNAMMGRIIAHV